MDFKLLIDLAKDTFSVLESLKDKLLNAPKQARVELENVLDELKKIYVAMDSELVKFLSLDFPANSSYSTQRNILFTLEGNQLELRLEEARGHCHRIGDIYNNHLDKAFSNIFNAEESGRFRNLFHSLANTDQNMTTAIYRLAGWLSENAKTCLDYLDKKDSTGAGELVERSRQATKEVRAQMGEAIIMLEKIKNQLK